MGIHINETLTTPRRTSQININSFPPLKGESFAGSEDAERNLGRQTKDVWVSLQAWGAQDVKETTLRKRTKTLQTRAGRLNNAQANGLEMRRANGDSRRRAHNPGALRAVGEPKGQCLGPGLRPLGFREVAFRPSVGAAN